jgi:phage terminase Nu1 subunit (DNA packaging protein)
MEVRERHRATWDAATEDELRQRVEAGEFLPAIARSMGRSQEAIRTRANLLGIPVRFAAKRIMPSRRDIALCGSNG